MNRLGGLCALCTQPCTKRGTPKIEGGETAFAPRSGSATTAASLLEALRESTRSAHEGLDAAFSRLDLAQARDYETFLRAHFIALAPLQTVYHDFCRQTLDLSPPDLLALLRRDLADLDVETQSLPTLTAEDAILAAPAGLAYVLAGSRLGLTVIGKQPHFGADANAPSRFMDDTEGLGVWRTLSAWLKRQPGTGEQADAAVASATGTFVHFHAALAACDLARD